jgi:hypothetical protein
MQKITPGPWRVIGANVYGNNLRALVPMNGADARLIAAAPDLLVALRQIADSTPEGDAINTIARTALSLAD